MVQWQSRSCKKRVLTLIGILLVGFSAQSQEVKTYNFPGANCYSNTLFIQTAQNPKGVLVMDVGEREIKVFAKNNLVASSNMFKDYNFLYIKILEERSKNSISCFQTIADVMSRVYHIEKKVFYFLKEEDSNGIEKNSPTLITSNTLNIIEGSFNDLDGIKKKLDDSISGQNYLRPKEWSTEQLDSIKINHYEGNIDVGLNYAPSVLIGNKFGIKSNFIGMFSPSIELNLNEKTALVLNLNYSRANKTKIQQEITASGKKDTINSHALLGADILLRKHIQHKEQIRFFYSGGLGFYTIIDTDLKKRSSSLYVKNYESQYITPILEGGIEYRISPVLGVTAALPFRYFISTKDTNLNTISIGLTIGIAFTLNTNRAVKTLNN